MAPKAMAPMTEPLAADDADAAPASQTVVAVERAADILVFFARADRAALGITEIASGLNLSKAVVHRVLASLRTRELIAYDDETRRYSLGPMALILGLTCLERLDVRQLASAELPQLSRQTGETTTVSLLAGHSRIYVDQVTPDRDVVMLVSLGVPFPLHAGSSSKAFLAFLPDEEIETYLEHTLEALTPGTITDKSKLRHEIRAIRRRGWADSVGERQSEAASVAAPIFDHRNRPAAVISVCGPADRFLQERDNAVVHLLETTTRLSRSLGAQVTQPAAPPVHSSPAAV